MRALQIDSGSILLLRRLELRSLLRFNLRERLCIHPSFVHFDSNVLHQDLDREIVVGPVVPGDNDVGVADCWADVLLVRGFYSAQVLSDYAVHFTVALANVTLDCARTGRTQRSDDKISMRSHSETLLFSPLLVCAAVCLLTPPRQPRIRIRLHIDLQVELLSDSGVVQDEYAFD